jgi:aminopeptidase N
VTAPDPYFPSHGDARYTVDHYDLALRYKISTNRLRGCATLTVRALAPLTSLRVDLAGLGVDAVRVDGVRPRKFSHDARAVTIRPAEPLAAGSTAELTIEYSGKPRPVPGPFGPAGWEELEDGVLVASQPYGAPSWFPCNDFAGAKATFAFEVTAEAGYTVVANGVLTGQERRGGNVTWSYSEARPMAPYLATVHVGRYSTTLLASGRPRVDLVAPAHVQAAGTPFDRLPAMMAALEDWFGPYPFAGYRCFVTPDALEIPLEAQGSASFGHNHAADTWDNERLVVHELAHQWFGNSLTAAQGRDIWLHEGFACYTEWLWSERRGFESADRCAREHWTPLADDPGDWPLADPGVHHMFDDAVYKRGALAVHALRGVLGDEAFFGLLAAWCAERAYSCVSTGDFVAFAQAHADADLAPLFDAWLYRPGLPEPGSTATATA